jgi:hypothetical protein
LVFVGEDKDSSCSINRFHLFSPQQGQKRQSSMILAAHKTRSNALLGGSATKARLFTEASKSKGLARPGDSPLPP